MIIILPRTRCLWLGLRINDIDRRRKSVRIALLHDFQTETTRQKYDKSIVVNLLIFASLDD